MIERTEGRFRTSDGEAIWYESAGDGPTLVLAHGLGGNAASWFQQVPHFADRYRVITWDQRGFGRSSNRTGQAGPEAAMSDQVALLDFLEIDTAHLVGQSMGGWAALGAAIASPDRVRSLVLACTTGGIPPREVPPLDPSHIGGTDSGARPLGVHPAVGDRLPSIDLPRAYLYQALGTFGERPADSEFARMLATTTHDPSALRQFDTPTLFICGSLDGVMTPERVRDAAGQLPDADVAELSRCGHSPYFEDPASWNAVVEQFLRSFGTP